MKATSAALSLLPALANAAHFPKEQYESGEVHQYILDMKNVSRLPSCSSLARRDGIYPLYTLEFPLANLSTLTGPMGRSRGGRRSRLPPVALVEELGPARPRGQERQPQVRLWPRRRRGGQPHADLPLQQRKCISTRATNPGHAPVRADRIRWRIVLPNSTFVVLR